MKRPADIKTELHIGGGIILLYLPAPPLPKRKKRGR